MRIMFLRRYLLPRGYEIVPVGLLETLADAANRPYAPAFGGNEDAVEAALNAGRAADNILNRYDRRWRGERV